MLYPRSGACHPQYTSLSLSSWILYWLQYNLASGPLAEISAHDGGFPASNQPLTFWSTLFVSCASSNCWRSQGSHPSMSLSTFTISTSDSVPLGASNVYSSVLHKAAGEGVSISVVAPQHDARWLSRTLAVDHPLPVSIFLGQHDPHGSCVAGICVHNEGPATWTVRLQADRCNITSVNGVLH